MERSRFCSRDICVRGFRDGTQDAFICIDSSYNIVAANPAAEAQIAGAGCSIVGRHSDDVGLPERLRGAIHESITAAKAGKAVARQSFLVEGLRADGRPLCAEAEVFAAGDAKKSCIVAHLHDVAERLQSEKKALRLGKILRTMSEGNRAMLDGADEQALYAAMCRVIVTYGGYALASVGLVEYDEERTVRPVAFAGTQDGYLSLARIASDDQLSGRGPAGIAIRTAVPQVCNDLIGYPFIEPWREAALKQGYRSLLALPLNEKGAAFGVLLIYAREPSAFGLEDVTLLVELAENLSFGVIALRDRNARGELEQALLHARKMEAIGELCGGIAHDFNNLLQVVNSSLYLLKRRPDDVAIRDVAIETIQNACKRAAAITCDLLTFARKEIAAPETMDPRAVAGKWRELISHSVGERVAVEIRIPPGTWPVYCDCGSLEIALVNLAINARDAMPDGGVLTVTTRNLRKDGKDFVEIDVTDTGCGIDPAVLSHVFEPFYTTKPLGMGTGLGLSQVYRFAKQSGGEARIASQPGNGVTVTIQIPRSLNAGYMGAVEEVMEGCTSSPPSLH